MAETGFSGAELGITFFDPTAPEALSNALQAAETTTFLDPDSAVDLTSMLDKNGVLHWTVPGGNWVVFGFWQRATCQITKTNPPFQSPEYWNSLAPTEYPGQYFIADIFSDKGIKTALDHLKENYLTYQNFGLLHRTLFAHDSHEVQAVMFWTSDLPQEFKARRGYSMIKYLPALHTPKESRFDPLTPYWGETPPLAPEYDFSNDVGDRTRYAYHFTLNNLYVERHLKTFTRWLHRHGMRSRAQVAYNYEPLNMTRSGSAIDIPENESFDSGWGIPLDPTVPSDGTDRWRHAIDSYRLTGSGAHIGARQTGDD